MDSPPLPPPHQPPAPQQITDLVQALERAAQLAKQLPSTTDDSHHRLIIAALHSAHLSLSSFLSLNHSALSNAGEPTQLAQNGDLGGDGEHNPEDSSMDGVEKRLRSFNIQNKRTKRSLSPSAVAMAERHKIGEREANETRAIDFDPYWTVYRSLDLVHQFHC